MRRNLLWITAALALLFLGLLGCEFEASTADIEDAWMARDYEGLQPTDIFGVNETFYCIVELKDAPDDTTIKAAWFAEDVEGVEENFLISESELNHGDGRLHFELGNENPWPVGRYEVELYINNRKDQSLDFEVR